MRPNSSNFHLGFCFVPSSSLVKLPEGSYLNWISSELALVSKVFRLRRVILFVGPSFLHARGEVGIRRCPGALAPFRLGCYRSPRVEKRDLIWAASVCLALLATSCKPGPKPGFVSGTIENDEVRVASRYGGRVEKLAAQE